MRIKQISLSLASLLLAVCVACSSNHYSAKTSGSADVKDQVSKALNDAGYKDVKIDVDRDKQLVTLTGDVNSDQDKQRAAQIAKDSAGDFVVANKIGVRPEGAGSETRKIDSNVDTAIEHDFKAQLLANHLDGQHIRYDAKNGVLTLKGSVRKADMKSKAEEIASKVPNVQQVVNEIEVKGPQPAKTRSGAGQ